MTDFKNLLKHEGHPVHLELKSGEVVEGFYVETSMDKTSIDLEVADGEYRAIEINDLKNWKPLDTSTPQTGPPTQHNKPLGEEFLLPELDTLLRDYSQTDGLGGLPEYPIPNFEIPIDLTGKQAAQTWDRFRNRLRHVIKSNQSDPKFQITPGLLKEFEQALGVYPNSAVFRRLTALCCYWVGDKSNGINHLEKLVQQGDALEGDFLRAAILAEQNGSNAACNRYLGKYFVSRGNPEPFELWRWWVQMVRKEKQIAILKELAETLPLETHLRHWIALFEAVAYCLAGISGMAKAQQWWSEIAVTRSPVASLLTVLQSMQEALPQPANSSPTDTTDVEAKSRPLRRGCRVRMLDSKKGFVTDETGQEYYFHSKNISYSPLLKQLQKLLPGKTYKLRLVFEPILSESQKWQAEALQLERSPVEIKQLAVQAAHQGKFDQAIQWADYLCKTSSGDKEFNQQVERWHQLLDRDDMPTGEGPYAMAWRYQHLNDDLPKAIRAYLQAIDRSDQVLSAIQALSRISLNGPDRFAFLGRCHKHFQELKRDPDLFFEILWQAHHLPDHGMVLDLSHQGLRECEDPHQQCQLLKFAGESHLALGQYAEAIEDLQKLLQLAPHHEDERITLARCYFLAGRNDEARQWVSPEVWQALAQEYAQKEYIEKLTDRIESLQTIRHTGAANEPTAAAPVLVLGTSEIKNEVMQGIARAMGMSPNLLEIRNDYDKNRRFDVEQLRNSSYAGILLGPIAHKVVKVGSYSSLLQKLVSEKGFPPVVGIRVKQGKLKVSKTAFRTAMLDLLKQVGRSVGLSPEEMENLSRIEQQLHFNSTGHQRH